MFQHQDVPNKVDQDQAGDAVEQVHEAVHAGDEELQLEEDEVDIENASLVVHPGDLGELADVEQMEEQMEVLEYVPVLFEEFLSFILNIFLHC